MPNERTAAASSYTDPSTRVWGLAASIWLLLIGLMVFANPGTVEFVVHHWQSDAYGHSWLVVAISLWLVWRLREPLMAMDPKPSVWGMALLVGISAIWWLGYVLEVRAAQQLALIAAVTGITWAILGTRVTWLLAFPLLYLFLTVSAWDVLIRPLQDATAWLSGPTLRLLGVPVLQEGHYLSIPEGRFLVDEDCAGLRYFMAGLSLGALFAYLSFDDLWRRTLFIGLTVFWVSLLNVVRVSAVVYAGHLTDMQHPWVHDHGDMGWVLFAVALVPLFLVGNLMHRLRPRLKFSSSFTVGTATPREFRGLTVAALVGALAIISVPLGAHGFETRAAAASVHGVPPELPVVEGWDGPRAPPDSWDPHFPAVDEQESGAYRSAAGSVYLYLGWYAYERGNAKLLYFGNWLFERRQWRVLTDQRYTQSLDGSVLELREQVLQKPSGEGYRVLWSWYRVDDAVTSQPLRAKLLGLRGVLRGRPGAAVVALASDAADAEAARALLGGYLAMAPELHP